MTVKEMWADLKSKYPEIYITAEQLSDAMKDLDAVCVVRCKDCKYYLNSDEKCGLIDTRLHFYETDKVWTADCFCAWGEQKEEVEE